MNQRFEVLAGGMGRNPSATEEALTRLQAQAQVPLPADYLAFLRWNNGVEGEIGPNYIAFYSAEDVAENGYAGYVYQDSVPGLWFIGGEGGAALLAFDTRTHPMPIVVTHTDELELAGLVTMAVSCGALLERLAIEDWIEYWSAHYLQQADDQP
jgi:hypothetical protein